MTPRVVCKVVRRYFVGGKGYASAYEAYRSIAKKELGEKLRHLVDADLIQQGLDPYSCSEDPRNIAVHKAMRSMFPPDSTCGDDAYGFDNDARQLWIRNRAEELRGMDNP